MSLPLRKPGDWFCPNCNFLIFGSKYSCKKCGAINPNVIHNSNAKKAGRRGSRFNRKSNRTNIHLVTNYNDNKRNNFNDWMCPNCDFLIFGSKKSCKKCGASNPCKRGRRKSKIKNIYNNYDYSDEGNDEYDDYLVAKALQNKYDYDYATKLQNDIKDDHAVAKALQNKYDYDAKSFQKNDNNNDKDNTWWISVGDAYNYAKSFLQYFAYNNDNSSDTSGCIDGNGLVLMADGNTNRISQLNIDDKVYSFPHNIATIKAIMITNVNKEMKMVKLNNYNDDTHFFITYKHPILINNDNNWNININKCISLKSLNENEINQYNLKWTFPQLVCVSQMRYQDKIYNFVLDKHHTINVNGYWCVTLGDDYYKGNNIGHPLWRSSVAVNQYLNDIKNKPDAYPHIEIITDQK